jgi:hemolysin activation/secretion protein
MGQQVGGGDLPVHALATLGGNRTMRGYPQDRFLDKTMIVSNVEVRFPIFWRFGGIAGIDAGKVWSSAGMVDLHNWPWNYVVGLRFYMDTFVVRGDVGVSKETTGFYLNFGQLF